MYQLIYYSTKAEYHCCLICDVSFAPPAAVWIALNPTQVTMSFTKCSDFHLILSQSTQHSSLLIFLVISVQPE